RRGDGFAFIDFETAGHGWRIYDLASVTALWRMGWGPPLLAGTEPAQAAAAFVEGYHSVRPLRPEERAALEPFERARLFEFMGYWMAEVASGKQGSRNCVPHLETVLATLRAWDAAAAPAAAFRPASLSV
ncbi:MAG TPA: phosphotransferase, partial [Longimicrobium sp.]|nr:phosphotransferase [Longimicrobium sp.]